MNHQGTKKDENWLLISSCLGDLWLDFLGSTSGALSDYKMRYAVQFNAI